MYLGRQRKEVILFMSTQNKHFTSTNKTLKLYHYILCIYLCIQPKVFIN